MNDVKYVNTIITVSIPDTKSHIERKFTIKLEFANTVQKYMKLKPSIVTKSNVFLCYLNGTRIQVIGK